MVQREHGTPVRSPRRGRCVWFLDVDVHMDGPLDVLGRLQPQFDDPLVGAVAPRVRGGDGATVRDRFEQRFSPLDMGVRSALVVPGGAVPYVPSACLLVRRDCFGAGFDDALRVGEDVDLVWRLHDRGWLVRYVADAVVTHRARASWRRWWSQRVDYGASIGRTRPTPRHPDGSLPRGRVDALRVDQHRHGQAHHRRAGRAGRARPFEHPTRRDHRRSRQGGRRTGGARNGRSRRTTVAGRGEELRTLRPVGRLAPEVAPAGPCGLRRWHGLAVARVAGSISPTSPWPSPTTRPTASAWSRARGARDRSAR